jgi:hypothetical protein
MACACKVTKYVNRIEKRYGNKTWNSKKSNVSGIIKNVIKKGVVILICIPIVPIMLTYILVRNCFTKKAISIDKVFKLR